MNSILNLWKYMPVSINVLLGNKVTSISKFTYFTDTLTHKKTGTKNQKLSQKLKISNHKLLETEKKDWKPKIEKKWYVHRFWSRKKIRSRSITEECRNCYVSGLKWDFYCKNDLFFRFFPTLNSVNRWIFVINFQFSSFSPSLLVR